MCVGESLHPKSSCRGPAPVPGPVIPHSLSHVGSTPAFPCECPVFPNLELLSSEGPRHRGDRYALLSVPAASCSGVRPPLPRAHTQAEGCGMVVGAGEGQPGPAKHGTHPLRNPHSGWGSHLHASSPFAHLVYQWSMPVSSPGELTVHSIPLFSISGQNQVVGSAPSSHQFLVGSFRNPSPTEALP